MLAVMIIASTALATVDDAFANKKKKTSYEKSQAVIQANHCGNSEAVGSTIFGAFEIWCQNQASQIQGDDNSAALSNEQS
jgi:hypothetical protein